MPSRSVTPSCCCSRQQAVDVRQVGAHSMRRPGPFAVEVAAEARRLRQRGLPGDQGCPRSNFPTIQPPIKEPRSQGGTIPYAPVGPGDSRQDQQALRDRFHPPRSDPAKPQQPKPAQARPDGIGAQPRDDVSFSTELVDRSGKASSRMRSSRVRPSWSARCSGANSRQRFAAGGGKLGDFTCVCDADSSPFTNQPMAACRVGAVNGSRDRADGPAQGFCMVGRVERAGAPASLHHDRDRCQCGDEPVPLQEPVPGGGGARRDLSQDSSLVGYRPEQVFVARWIEAVHSPGHDGDGGHGIPRTARAARWACASIP